MNTIQLECFIAVAEHLNFSRASEELKITQPAVSHQIRTLEEELDVKLFKRTSKSVSLTPEGVQFLPDAELILKTAFSAKERLGRRENFIVFEVGCHNHMELNLLPPVFRKLGEEFPMLRPSVRMVPFPSLLGMVENQKIHAAFQIKEGQKKAPCTLRSCFPPLYPASAPRIIRWRIMIRSQKNSSPGASSPARQDRFLPPSSPSRTGFSPIWNRSSSTLQRA